MAWRVSVSLPSLFSSEGLFRGAAFFMGLLFLGLLLGFFFLGLFVRLDLRLEAGCPIFSLAAEVGVVDVVALDDSGGALVVG